MSAYCLAEQPVGDEILECNRAQHQDGEPHYDKEAQVFWVGYDECEDFESISPGTLETS